MLRLRSGIIPIPIRFPVSVPFGTTGTYNKARTNGNDGPDIGSETSETMAVVGEQSLSQSLFAVAVCQRSGFSAKLLRDPSRRSSQSCRVSMIPLISAPLHDTSRR